MPPRWSKGFLAGVYPGEWFEGVAIPFVEDLVNQYPLDLFVRWRHQQGLDMEGSCNPVLAAPSVRQKMRTFTGCPVWSFVLSDTLQLFGFSFGLPQGV